MSSLDPEPIERARRLNKKLREQTAEIRIEAKAFQRAAMDRYTTLSQLNAKLTCLLNSVQKAHGSLEHLDQTTGFPRVVSEWPAFNKCT